MYIYLFIYDFCTLQDSSVMGTCLRVKNGRQLSAYIKYW